VTHDQVEALTFAEEVVVMTRGKAVQVGSAEALFERPAHTFVGHFIGSPGMNFLSAKSANGALEVAGTPLVPTRELPQGALKIGIRPEYLRLSNAGAAGAVPAVVKQVQDVGTHAMLSAQVDGSVIKVRLHSDEQPPAVGDTVWLRVLDAHTCYYKDEELVA
jgi:glycerol transport system ATP-binding protein